MVTQPTVTGLTTAQLQTLPASFDPTIWGVNANYNNFGPYLLLLVP